MHVLSYCSAHQTFCLVRRSRCRRRRGLFKLPNIRTGRPRRDWQWTWEPVVIPSYRPRQNASEVYFGHFRIGRRRPKPELHKSLTKLITLFRDGRNRNLFVLSWNDGETDEPESIILYINRRLVLITDILQNFCMKKLYERSYRTHWYSCFSASRYDCLAEEF